MILAWGPLSMGGLEDPPFPNPSEIHTHPTPLLPIEGADSLLPLLTVSL